MYLANLRSNWSCFLSLMLCLTTLVNILLLGLILVTLVGLLGVSASSCAGLFLLVLATGVTGVPGVRSSSSSSGSPSMSSWSFLASALLAASCSALAFSASRTLAQSLGCFDLMWCLRLDVELPVKAEIRK